MMLSTFRAATRCLPRCSLRRGLSSEVSQNDQKALLDSLAYLGSDTKQAAVPVPPPVVPTTTRLPLSAQNIMNIPPAQDPLLSYLTSWLTRHGHRAKASRLLSKTMLNLHTWTRAPPLPILQQAILDAAPAVRCLQHKRGGKVIVKPIALSEKQRTLAAVKAILKEIEKKPGRLPEKLAREMIAIVKGDSQVLRQKETIHKYAMVNRGNIRI